jgi:membrane-bound ClpP family serine protease
MALDPKIKKAAANLGQAEGADVLLFNGQIGRHMDADFIRACVTRRRRDKVVLALVTPGGDADVAYRMARCLQTNYPKGVTIFVPGWCKSAGTLLAMGAHRLVFSDYGELGPLDIQIGKQDDLFEAGSGLDLDAALKQLERTAYEMFQNYMLAIENQSEGRITFRTASQISYRLVSRLLQNVYAQVDPMKMGETTRLMKIAKDYGERLDGTLAQSCVVGRD